MEGRPATEEQKLLKFLITNYDPAVRPVYDARKPVIIKLGITLTQIIDVVSYTSCVCVGGWVSWSLSNWGYL